MFRHAGLDPASRRSRKSWIPAFAGMTTLIEGVICKQTLNKGAIIEKKFLKNLPPAFAEAASRRQVAPLCQRGVIPPFVKRRKY